MVPPPSSLLYQWFSLSNPLLRMSSQNSCFVGHLESTSLRAEMLIEVRLPISGSSQTLPKHDPHWELLLLLKYTNKACTPFSFYDFAFGIFDFLFFYFLLKHKTKSKSESTLKIIYKQKMTKYKTKIQKQIN